MMVLDLSNFKTIFGRLESFSKSQKELGMSKCFKSFEWYRKKSCGLWKIFSLSKLYCGIITPKMKLIMKMLLICCEAF